MRGLSFQAANPATPKTPLSAKAESIFLKIFSECFRRILSGGRKARRWGPMAGRRGRRTASSHRLAPYSACRLRDLSRFGIPPSLGAQLKLARLKAPGQLVRAASALERLRFNQVG